MNFRKIFLISLLLLVVLLFGGLFFLLGTKSGLPLLLNNIVRWTPGLQIGETVGNLQDLTLKDIQYERAGVNVKLATLHLALKPSCLKKMELCFSDLSLNDADIRVDPSAFPAVEQQPKTKGNKKIQVPYPIDVDHLKLHNVQFTLLAEDEPQATQISLDDLSTGLRWRGSSLKLKTTYLQTLLVKLPEEKKPAEKKTIEDIQALFEAPLLPPLSDFILPIDINAQEIRAKDIQIAGSMALKIDKLLLSAESQDSRLQLHELNFESEQGQLNAKGEASFSGHWPVTLRLNTHLNLPHFRGQQVKAHVSGEMARQLHLVMQTAGNIDTKLTLVTEPMTAGLPLNLDLKSSHLQWPFEDPAGPNSLKKNKKEKEIQYQADGFELHVGGKAKDYKISMRAALKGKSLPGVALELEGKGNLEQLKINELKLSPPKAKSTSQTALQGKIDARGLVRWRKGINWQAEAKLTEIDTKNVYPNWPTKIEGHLRAEGHLAGNTWDVKISDSQLKGTIKQNVFSANMMLSGDSDNQWNIKGIHLILGRNTLDLKGRVGNYVDLLMNIDAPYLDNTLPGLTGVLKGTFRGKGTLQKPEILADLQGSRLGWQGLRIGSLDLNADIDSGDQIAGKLSLKIEDLQQDPLSIQKLTLIAEGNEKEHRLRIDAAGQPATGQLLLTGHFSRKNKHWRGAVTDTGMRNTPVGDWLLTNAIDIDYFFDKQKLTLSAHCWQNPKAEICAPERIDIGQEGKVNLTLDHLDVSLFKPLLTSDTTLSGMFNGHLDINWSQKKSPSLTGEILLKGEKIKLTKMIEGTELPITFDSVDFSTLIKNGDINTDWLIQIAQNGEFSGSVQVRNPQKGRQLSGNIDLKQISLGFIEPVLTEGERVSGLLNSQLRLDGNLKQPRVYGQLKISDVNAKTSFLPVTLIDSNLDMVFDGLTSTLHSVLRTEKGQLNVDGEADWQQSDNWNAKIVAKGDQISVIYPPMVKMDISPDIVLSASPTDLKLDGLVDIPYGRLSVQEIPQSAVKVSPDEVMLDEHLELISEKATPIVINSNLSIRLGHDVRIDAFQLKAKLEGELKLMQSKNGLGLNGQIKIPTGSFRAYGQDLIIRKGELQFSGPIEQPYINLEAIRNPDSTEDNVTAGLRATGLVDEIKMDIFSEPTMSQQEAISYLLRGQGLASAADGGNALTSALVGMGVAKSGQIVGKIGEAFGIDHLAIDTAGVGHSQQVQLSGYILPGLQVKYGVGIFDALATFTMRYRLMPKLYLEAVSGINQALDVLYQLEF